jgi:hypothetical protein
MSHFLKRMVLISYGLMFITKEIRAVCVHIPRRKKKGKWGWGVERDWERNLGRYVTDVP